ncbi:hypothetical protein LGM89_33895 [Burkholderia sp. AU31624]|nr:hypothetical protein [Burkholderia sp. AU31624]
MKIHLQEKREISPDLTARSLQERHQHQATNLKMRPSKKSARISDTRCQNGPRQRKPEYDKGRRKRRVALCCEMCCEDVVDSHEAGNIRPRTCRYIRCRNDEPGYMSPHGTSDNARAGKVNAETTKGREAKPPGPSFNLVRLQHSNRRQKRFKIKRLIF